MNTKKQMLLDEYKKYDKLNLTNNNPLVKILVSYIKPSFLFKSEILTPIHLGRAVEQEQSKDGILNNNDLIWLHENCIGDNDFVDNISAINRRVGFLTGTYWAYKNYAKLGNPTYIGSFGYRKLFSSNCLENVEDFDLILPQKTVFEMSLKEQFIKDHGTQLYKAMLDTLKKVYPQDVSKFLEYFNRNSGYFYEIYIMKKELFNEFCEWILKYLFKILELFPNFIESHMEIDEKEKSMAKFLEIDNKTYQNKIYQKPDIEFRDIAFIMERITGYFLYRASQKPIKYKEVPVIQLEYVEPKEIYKNLLLKKMRNNIRRSIKND